MTDAPTRKQILEGCRHFNGIQHDKCRAGVSYDNFGLGKEPLPCKPGMDGQLHGSCPFFAFETEEEIEAHEAAGLEAARKYLMALANGLCPHCGKPTDPKRQVGRCVYGACGCRLYQGKLKRS